MSNLTNTTFACIPGSLCEVLFYQVELIVVPVLFLLLFLAIMIILLVLKCSHKKSYRHKHHRKENDHTQHHHNTQGSHRSNRRHLQGIDAPAELNPMEHEVIPMTAQAPHEVQSSASAIPQQTTERHPSSFQLLSPLPISFSVKQDNFTLHRAAIDRQPVILRVLKESANARERQSFLGFSHFLSELGPHESLPKLLGVVSARTPLMMAVEELEHRDLLGFLWRCRQDHTGQAAPCDMTERRIFTMGAQIASALEYLHSKNCIHGNVKARSVLVGQDLSVKLWGLGPAYHRKSNASSIEDLEEIETRKWQAPELLARQPLQQSSDVWSFGILLYEMVTLGEAPFPNIMASELLQHLQRENTLKRPPNCSNTLYSIMKSCCKWRAKDRVSLAELIRKLQSGERSANDQAVLRVSEPLDIEKYMQEAGYGESLNYAVL
ncbi:tyrosine-protein kinase STYK1 [Danio rerio]|uniref:Serine/threonine/tyrosine kinase 1a n=1 Tax=Danio rerio TaxID=7955 RepID=F1Q614_DANRE|nr:tyrosine-protein kinase STYK1 [Danio rerio]|eukprot:XP_005159545.1 tyrosine-protein kinase STYK1 [Danio rerio]